MEKICENCRYWEISQGQECKYCLCSHTKMRPVLEVKTFNELPNDCILHHGCLFGAKFGCIYWQSKKL